jgi:hypothetical protein
VQSPVTKNQNTPCEVPADVDRISDDESCSSTVDLVRQPTIEPGKRESR